MCIITDINDIVVEMALIPGLNPINKHYNVYFPYAGKIIPQLGDKFIDKESLIQKAL
jgi:hypothetical protein